MRTIRSLALFALLFAALIGFAPVHATPARSSRAPDPRPGAPWLRGNHLRYASNAGM